MDSRQAVRAACSELANRLSGMELGGDDEVDLRLTDPAMIIDFHKLSHGLVKDADKPPNLYEVSITLPNTGNSANFPWLTYYTDYIQDNPTLIEGEAVVSFVQSTGNKNTDRSYVSERRDNLEDRGIRQEDQILIVLPGCIPEKVTQLLTIYYLISKGWMVTEDKWYSPTLQPSDLLRAPMYGIPDIVAWKSEFTAKLAGRGWIREGGSIHELAMLSVRGSHFDRSAPSGGEADRTLVGEVKASDVSLGQSVKQLYKRGSNNNPGYLKSQCFDEGYGVVALEKGRDRNGAGTITFNENGFHHLEDQADLDYDGSDIEGETRSDQEKKQILISQLDTVAAQTLLCNIPFNRLTDAVDARRVSANQFLTQAWSLSEKQILTICEDEL